MKFAYPPARRDMSVVDDYHGTKVVDPYRWLEDPDSEETKAFVEAQNDLSSPFIEQCEYRQKIHDSLTEKWNFAKYSSPAEHGGHYYYYHNTGLQNQSVMYIQDNLDSEPRVFFDPNKLSEDGTLAISGTAFSEDGSYFAYGLSQSGSDWITIKFKECPSGKDLPDTLEHVKFSSMAWTHDNKGMFYNRYPVDGKSDGTETTSNFYHRLYYHVLGTEQSEDVLAVEFVNEPKWKLETTVANGNSASTPHFSLPSSNNNANQIYETSYALSSVAVAAGATSANSYPFYGASAPPAYGNYYSPNFYGLSYSPSRSKKTTDKGLLHKQTLTKLNPEKPKKKNKNHSNQKLLSKSSNNDLSTSTQQLYNNNNNNYNNINNSKETSSQCGQNQRPNQPCNSGIYGQPMYSYNQQYESINNGPSSQFYYSYNGATLNPCYPSAMFNPYESSHAASAVTNLSQCGGKPSGENKINSSWPPSRPMSPMPVLPTPPYFSSPKCPSECLCPETKLDKNSASPQVNLTLSATVESTTLPRHVISPVNEAVSYPSYSTTPIARTASSYSSHQTSPVAGSVPYPSYPISSVTGSASYSSCPTLAGSASYPFCPTSPVAVSTSYPSCPTSSIAGSVPYSPNMTLSKSGLTPCQSNFPTHGIKAASFFSHPNPPIAQSLSYAPYTLTPTMDQSSYPTHPNSSSYPFSPYCYQQSSGSPYPYYSYPHQPPLNSYHSNITPIKTSYGQTLTSKDTAKICSYSKSGKYASTPDTMFVPSYRGAEVSDCGKYLLLSPNEGCDPVNRLFYVELDKLPNGITEKLPYTILVDNFDAQYEYITNEGSVFTFLTNLNAPKYKVINIDFNKPQQENWQTLIEEDENAVLEWVSCVNNNKLVLCYLKDVKNKLYIHSLESGKFLKEIQLDIGTVIGCSGKKKNKEIFIHFMSFLTPGVIYRVDLSVDDPKPEIYRLIKVNNFDFSQFEIKQVFYPSKDGTKIPMFLVHKKGLVLDGQTPTYLYGYGGFDISIKPTFSVSRLVFLKDFGGLFAVANIRGGGEYGETWHKSGTHSKKQNVFDDFQAAAEYLIQQKYTKPQKLVIHGHSNGGLLIAACINQRPELYGCAVAQVGVLDMLRFHKFTIGHAWTTDFGCSDIPEHFKFLKEYSPIHNIRVPKGDIQYPSTLLVTADHDDRVVPLHSLKYIAELQYTMKDEEKQTKPLMIKVDTKAGHGRGKPTAKMIQEYTDLYCYIMKTLELTWHEN